MRVGLDRGGPEHRPNSLAVGGRVQDGGRGRTGTGLHLGGNWAAVGCWEEKGGRAVTTKAQLRDQGRTQW